MRWRKYWFRRNDDEAFAYMAEKPEEFLEYSDWMGIPIQPYSVTLERFKYLLVEQAQNLLNVWEYEALNIWVLNYYFLL